MNKYNIDLKSYDSILLIHQKSKISYYFWAFLILFMIILFLPWTQNIKSKGYITTLLQEERPQKINSPIPGKIEKWYVKEGDFVQKGDTILTLSEIKEDYLDPNLVANTQFQADVKKESISFYKDKIGAIDQQIKNLLQSKELKIAQLDNKLIQINNKLESEKADLLAIENELELVKNQYERQQAMFDEGLVSQTQLQDRKIKYQNVVAKQISIENKIAQTQQEILNIAIEKNSAIQEYTEKINKAEGDKFQNRSQIATTQAEVSKLENQVVNYTIRNGMYILLAPQDGQIVQVVKAGIGEILKDGEAIGVIVPDDIKLAVEMFVKPMDLPLINVGQEVRFVFDGFPAIVFTGWPESSYGTFSGIIMSYENTISKNGAYRILVSPNKNDKKWPDQLRIGTGAQGILLLKNVSIWYELWRNINGFPPDFYVESEKIEK